MKKSWKRLVIDTATSHIYLSLVIDEQEMDNVYEMGLNNHSVTIMPQMERLLKRHEFQLPDIDEVIVGIGPGSYTGVRIGVAIAKMIGYLNQIKIQTVSSLALLASSADDDWILPLIDARRNNAYMGLYHFNGETLENRVVDTLANIEAFKKDHLGKAVIVTSGKPRIDRIIASDLLSEVANIHELVPNYLQITEAERNRNLS
ncbi:MAG: tRNA (adenosine(37)-N6)-threonylcarbamoyltransferase complex dimerization subunit type 1 TsaB [Candidatus Izemoplasmatales bacterium]|jgi:tRNA threonylcarbamoyladenosine biosynthesis protein TsaB|nr:tRNA (adenosine(37)-N6)-threonylcarbamoyltransferase complex dimerization subunit type 1 TsaB [Candidatus Izemoplasmatales bacterium]